MIHINLLPGGGRGRASKVSIAASAAALVARVKDPYLVVMIVGVIGSAAYTGYMSLTLHKADIELSAREDKVRQDSALFAVFARDMKKAVARRDSVVRQVDVIRQIDE